MNWLHYVGQGYYSQDDFLDEAERIGVSRRIALRLLGGMNWGDRIWLAQGKMKHRQSGAPGGATLFAYFDVTTIGCTGAGPEALGFGTNVIDGVSRPVNRECGSYTLVGVYRISTSLTDLATRLRATSLDAAVFLQGPIHRLPEPVRLVDYSFRWGYQRLDEVLINEIDYGVVEISGLFPNAWSAEDVIDRDGKYAKLENYEVKE